MEAHASAGERKLGGRVDSREAWLIAIATLIVPSISFGATYLVIVAMLGTGVGGLAMGWLAERIGTRLTVMMGAVMMCAGLILSSGGEVWQLYLGHGLLVGFLGNGAINAPLYVYITMSTSPAGSSVAAALPSP
jgi:MFS family permease